MKAIQITKYGDASVLAFQNIPKPTLKADEVLVRLQVIGVNFIDIYMRMGDPIIPVSLPFIPGVEGSGIVEEVGEDVSEIKIGDRVAYAGVLGSYAEYAVVPASQLIPLPQDINFETGAAFPLQGLTAQYLVNECYCVKQDDNVLVHAAAGGVGLLVVQWLKHLGARVIGTVSTEEKAKIARNAGIDDVIIYTKQNFAIEVKKLTNGSGVDYIIDGVGKDTFLKNLEAIRIRGHICIFGLASGAVEPISPNALQPKSITLTGGNLMNYITSNTELLKRANKVIHGIQQGWLQLNMNHIFSFEHVADAQRALESRQTTGKVLIKITS